MIELIPEPLQQSLLDETIAQRDGKKALQHLAWPLMRAAISISPLSVKAL